MMLNTELREGVSSQASIDRCAFIVRYVSPLALASGVR